MIIIADPPMYTHIRALLVLPAREPGGGSIGMIVSSVPITLDFSTRCVINVYSGVTIPATRAEQEQVTARRVLLCHGPRQLREPIKPAPHVRRHGGEPDPRAVHRRTLVQLRQRRQADHAPTPLACWFARWPIR